MAGAVEVPSTLAQFHKDDPLVASRGWWVIVDMPEEVAEQYRHRFDPVELYDDNDPVPWTVVNRYEPSRYERADQSSPVIDPRRRHGRRADPAPERPRCPNGHQPHSGDPPLTNVFGAIGVTDRTSAALRAQCQGLAS